MQVDMVSTTMSMADINHAELLKRACLEFASNNLLEVMKTQDYADTMQMQPNLQVYPHPTCNHTFRHLDFSSPTSGCFTPLVR